LHRFGTRVGVWVDGCLTLIFCLLPVPTETALERDYFMTGSSLPPWSPRRQTHLSSAAQDALEFGIVDGILERRPKFDAEST
jgi:hypothetical protein